MEALEIYYSSIVQKADEIEGYYRNQDYQSYTIKVHALKSSSRLVGAVELSELARELEQAGKDGDIGLIKKKTDGLLKDFRCYRELLAPIFDVTDDTKENGAGEGKAVPSADTLQDAYSSILEFSNMMDNTLVSMVLKSLREYELPEKDRRIADKIQELLLKLDWDGIRAVLSESGVG